MICRRKMWTAEISPNMADNKLNFRSLELRRTRPALFSRGEGNGAKAGDYIWLGFPGTLLLWFRWKGCGFPSYSPTLLSRTGATPMFLLLLLHLRIIRPAGQGGGGRHNTEAQKRETGRKKVWGNYFKATRGAAGARRKRGKGRKKTFFSRVGNWETGASLSCGREGERRGKNLTALALPRGRTRTRERGTDSKAPSATGPQCLQLLLPHSHSFRAQKIHSQTISLQTKNTGPKEGHQSGAGFFFATK